MMFINVFLNVKYKGGLRVFLQKLCWYRFSLYLCIRFQERSYPEANEKSSLKDLHRQ